MLGRPPPPLALLLTGALVSACQGAGSDPQTSEGGATPTAPAERSAEASPTSETPPLGSTGVELHFRPPADTAWIEEVETELFSHRSDELPPESPTLRTLRIERFEVLSAQTDPSAGPEAGKGVRLRVTLTALRLEPLGGPVFDSREHPDAPTSELVLEQLSLLGAPLVYRLSDAGETLEIEDVDAYRSAAELRHSALREEAGLPAPTSDDEGRWRAFLDAELAKPMEWGIRPKLPTTPVQVGSEWTHEVRTSTLFNASALWPIRKQLVTDDGEQVTIHRDADASFEDTAAMKRFITSANASLEGLLVLDRESGALVRTETTVTGMVEAAPQPEAGFPGGTLKLRNITKRRRLEEAKADPAPATSAPPVDGPK